MLQRSFRIYANMARMQIVKRTADASGVELFVLAGGGRQAVVCARGAELVVDAVVEAGDLAEVADAELEAKALVAGALARGNMGA